MCSENTGWAKDSRVPVKEGYYTVLEDGEVSYVKYFINPHELRTLGIVGLLYIHSL